MPHFFTLSNFSTATPRETSSVELAAPWFDDPSEKGQNKNYVLSYALPLKFARQTETTQVMIMSEDSVDMAMSLVIPGCWFVCWPSWLPADRLLGKLTPLDLLRMSEMSMRGYRVRMRRGQGAKCVSEKLGSRTWNWTADYEDWKKKVRLFGRGYMVSWVKKDLQ